MQRNLNPMIRGAHLVSVGSGFPISRLSTAAHGWVKALKQYRTFSFPNRTTWRLDRRITSRLDGRRESLLHHWVQKELLNVFHVTRRPLWFVGGFLELGIWMKALRRFTSKPTHTHTHTHTHTFLCVQVSYVCVCVCVWQGCAQTCSLADLTANAPETVLNTSCRPAHLASLALTHSPSHTPHIVHSLPGRRIYITHTHTHTHTRRLHFQLLTKQISQGAFHVERGTCFQAHPIFMCFF